MKLLILITSLLITGCAIPINQKADAEIYYKRDMYVEVNGRKAYGTLVVPYADKYKIKVKFPGKGDLVTLSTCHREEEHEKLGRFERIEFKPTYKEKDGLCSLEIAAFEYKKGRHAWALIDFESSQFTLPAKVKCNGKQYESRGTTICQSKQGLYQELEFYEPVTISNLAKCSNLEVDGNKVRFKVKPKECTYIIVGNSGFYHKLKVIGYEDILIRRL